MLPEIVDLFGMANLEDVEDIDIETPTEEEPAGDEVEDQVPETIESEPETASTQDPEDDIDSFFG